MTYEKTWSLADTDYVVFNDYTKEHYRWKNNILYAHDRFGNIITDFATTFTPAIFSVLPGGEANRSTDIAPNQIILPDSKVKTTDTTPTFITRVGESPAGWTQQFRIVGDRNMSTVANGVLGDTYEVAADSWSNGTHYDVTWNWEYAEDYDEVAGTGTWSALGTGDGLQTGGTEPANGVISTIPKARHIKCTVPPGSALAGAVTEDKWYFKIFSVST